MAISATTLVDMMLDPAVFRANLMMSTASGVKPWREATKHDPWQVGDLRALDPGMITAAGLPMPEGRQGEAIYSRAWLERHRGASKTQDLGILATWFVFAAQPGRRGIAVACSREQANYLLDAMRRIIRCPGNEFLSHLDIQASTIINHDRDVRIDATSSDLAVSWGRLIDACFIDEFTHFPEGSGEELYESLLSSVAKRPGAMLAIIANAGFCNSFQERIYQNAMKPDSGFYFHSFKGFASFFSKKNLVEMEESMSPLQWRRLFLSEWTTGEDSAITDADIRAAIVLKTEPRPNAAYREEYRSWAGVDIGITKNHSAVVVLSVPRSGDVIRLAYAKSWKPPRGGEVDLVAVNREILRLQAEFSLQAIHFDPSEARLSAQILRGKGLNMVKVSFGSPKSRDTTAQSLTRIFKNRQIQLFEHRELVRDLRALQIVDTGKNGMQLKGTTARDGSHCDLGTAIGLAAVPAEQAMMNRFYGASMGPGPQKMHVVNEPKRHGVRFDRGGRYGMGARTDDGYRQC